MFFISVGSPVFTLKNSSVSEHSIYPIPSLTVAGSSFSSLDLISLNIPLSGYILDSFTDDGTKARMIERFGSTDRLLRDRPCAYDDMGNLVDLTGTGLENEYDAEVMISPDGQLSII